MTIGAMVKQLMGRIAPQVLLYRGHGQGIALSFDDGPHPEQTLPLLEALRQLDVKATFFLQGAHAAQWPELVRETHAQGHQIANHAWSHASAKQVPTQVFVDEVERTQALLERIVGAPLPRDFRPPYGDITPAAFWQLARKGYRFVYWTVDSDDSTYRDAAVLRSNVAGLTVGNGDILLFHEDYAHTVTAIPAIVKGLRGAGLALRRIDQLSI